MRDDVSVVHNSIGLRDQGSVECGERQVTNSRSSKSVYCIDDCVECLQLDCRQDGECSSKAVAGYVYSSISVQLSQRLDLVDEGGLDRKVSCIELSVHEAVVALAVGVEERLELEEPLGWILSASKDDYDGIETCREAGEAVSVSGEIDKRFWQSYFIFGAERARPSVDLSDRRVGYCGKGCQLQGD